MAKTPRKLGPGTNRPPVATRSELNAFLGQLAALKNKFQHEEPISQREAIREYLRGFDRQQIQQLIGRAFADALKSPSQKLGTARSPSPGDQKQRDVKKSKRSKKSGRRQGRQRTSR